MKIVCEKGCDAGGMLEAAKFLLSMKCADYPVLREDLTLEIRLQDAAGQPRPKEEETIYLKGNDLQRASYSDRLWKYDCYDALTKLYNRAKYEQDIERLQTDKTTAVACVFADAVGLHEINNHLGHAAGDQMLRCIAETLRCCFPSMPLYRIGGDEFVVFCFRPDVENIRCAIEKMKQTIREREYEISVGMAVAENGTKILQAIDLADEAMREDKICFYRRHGNERQIRMMNQKLEKMLLERRDANQFLNAIASDYKGVYVIDPHKDSLRYIYIPQYFKALLDSSDGRFSEAIRKYCDTLVCSEDRALFEDVFDYALVLERLKRGELVGFTYHKTDGSGVHLQINRYDPGASGSDEMLWIFMDLG